MRSLLPCCIVVSVFVGVCRADDWPAFRGPNGSGRYAGSDPLPMEWSEDEGIRWTTDLPGAGASCPAVFGDYVVVTAYEGYGLNPENLEEGSKDDLKLHTLCFDRSTGEEIWRASFDGTDATPDATTRNTDHGFSTPTAALDETGVYVYFGVNGLRAYDWDGTERWSAVRGNVTKGFGTATSPVLFGDLVIQNKSIEAQAEGEGGQGRRKRGRNGPLVAHDKQTGEVVWDHKAIDSAWSTPTVLIADDGRPELVMNQKNTIFGFDPATGEKLWECAGIEDYVVPVVVGEAGVAYCFGGRQNRAIAVRLGGRGDVTETHKLWEVKVGANVTSPVLHDGRLFCIHDKAIYLVLDAATGETLARDRMPTRARVYASVVQGDGKLFAQTRDVGLLVLEPKNEFSLLAQNTLEPDVLWNAGPALADGVIYLRSRNRLYAVDGK